MSDRRIEQGKRLQAVIESMADDFVRTLYFEHRYLWITGDAIPNDYNQLRLYREEWDAYRERIAATAEEEGVTLTEARIMLEEAGDKPDIELDAVIQGPLTEEQVRAREAMERAIRIQMAAFGRRYIRADAVEPVLDEYGYEVGIVVEPDPDRVLTAMENSLGTVRADRQEGGQGTVGLDVPAVRRKKRGKNKVPVRIAAGSIISGGPEDWNLAPPVTDDTRASRSRSLRVRRPFSETYED